MDRLYCMSFEKWLKTYPELIEEYEDVETACEDCDGTGTITCDECDSEKDCETCDGTGNLSSEGNNNLRPLYNEIVLNDRHKVYTYRKLMSKKLNHLGCPFSFAGNKK